MPNLFSRTDFQARVAATFSDPEAIRAKLSAKVGDVTLPPEVEGWLSRLKLLAGVPINYLVPDEGMLPPESIRFFYLNMNWVDAVVDGAYSLGRNLTQKGEGPKMTFDRAMSPTVHQQAAAATANVRATAFGVAAPAVSLKVISGFLLRSSVVISCPGLGVFAYDADGKELTLLRFERLGPGSDTLICMVDGDLERADIHEPPEGLHYGIDNYSDENGVVKALKQVHTFSQVGDKVEVDPEQTPADVSPYFRSVARRTLRIAPLGNFIASFSKYEALDAAQMGFEMTQGVGLVSFKKRIG
jgi:hypothetical protein